MSSSLITVCTEYNMIPERFKNVKWDDVPKAIKDKIAGKPMEKGLYLHGAVGAGKTHIAYAIKKQWDELNPYHPAQFWNVTELIHEIKMDFDRFEKVYAAERLLQSDSLLILDDIGAEKTTEFVAETLYLIVNDRYEKMRPIIFTSNLPIGELAAKVGDRTASRIVEMCDIVNLEGGDRRIQ